MFQEVLAGSLKGLCVLAYRFASEPAPRFSASPLPRRTPEPKPRQMQEPHATRRAGDDCPAPRGSGSLTPNKKRFTGFIEYSPGAALIRAIFTDLFGKILILPNSKKAKILIYQCFPPFASLFTAANGQIAISAPHRYAALEHQSNAPSPTPSVIIFSSFASTLIAGLSTYPPFFGCLRANIEIVAAFGLLFAFCKNQSSR